MDKFEDRQLIKQLCKDRGSYFHVVISAEIVNQFPKKRLTRFICTLENKLSFQCGLNHLGDGNFFIILSSKRLKQLGRLLGDKIDFHLIEDPNPLGVAMPEELEVLLEQDKSLKMIFDDLTMGKKRHVIHSMNKIKNIDKKISKAIDLIMIHS